MELEKRTQVYAVGDDRDAAALATESERLKYAHAMGRRSVYTDLLAVHNKPPTNGEG